MAVPLIDLPTIHQPMQEAIEQAVLEVTRSGRFIFGPEVEKLEAAVAGWCGAAEAVGVSSGTDALMVGLMALGLGPGDEVIVPTFTFFASAGCIWRTGARPVFVDIDPVTWNLDPPAVEAAIGPRTRAIMPVHLFGQCAEMSAIMQLAQRHDLKIIEDAAQALGAKQDGRFAGTFGDVGCLSFFPTKNLGALGDAGMCLCRDAELAQKIRKLRHHGQTGAYEHQWVGGNFRLDAIQAAALNVKFPQLPGQIDRRREIACRYAEQLEPLPVEVPPVAEGQFHCYNYFTINAPNRDELREQLKTAQIGHAVYYPLPLHLQPCFAELGHKRGEFPNAEAASQRVISLPIYPGMTDRQVDEVVAAIKTFYA